jgi:S1-C subfamily serine protease
MWKELSEELSAATAKAAKGLAHVGGEDIAGRTGIVWADGFVVTLARQAADGEEVPVTLPGGEVKGTVHAWDSRTGLAVLKVAGAADPKWKRAAVPAVGSLTLTVAFPSPQGPEARLDAVRFVGASGEWSGRWGRGATVESFFQTDGSAWPGFTGAAVVDASGALVGWVVDNQPGNGGLIVSAADLARLVEPLIKSGSPKRAWLGVSTRPVGGQGLALLAVDEGSPAEQAGWKAGDLLVSLDGQALKDPADLVRVLGGLTPDQKVTARLLREGEVLDLAVTPRGR